MVNYSFKIGAKAHEGVQDIPKGMLQWHYQIETGGWPLENEDYDDIICKPKMTEAVRWYSDQGDMWDSNRTIRGDSDGEDSVREDLDEN
jgi:hypothetical protein